MLAQIVTSKTRSIKMNSDGCVHVKPYMISNILSIERNQSFFIAVLSEHVISV